MNSFGLEQSSQFRVFMDDVAKVNFVDFGVEVLSLIRVQKSIQGRIVRPLKPAARSQN
jgi:hypothetical protein